MPRYDPSSGFFSDSGLYPVWPHDPDAPRLLATGRYAMVDVGQPEVAAILASLQSQGNPTTAAGVYTAQSGNVGEVPQSWLGSVAEAASMANVSGLLATADKGSAVGAAVPNLETTALQTGLTPAIVSTALSQIHSVARSVYGSVDLGRIRQSSPALENGASGIRPGTMPRIVVPAWAARERGFPS